MELFHPKVPPKEYFVEISAVHRIRDAIADARDSGEPSYIVSKPGYGKTAALWYLSQEMGAKYWHVVGAQKSLINMYRAVLAAFGVWHDCTSVHHLATKITDSLRYQSHYGGPPPTLFVDEFQALESGAKRELMSIQEDCGIVLVLGGNAERLTGESKKDTLALEQVQRRFGMTITLPSLNEKDCIALASAYSVEGMDAFRAAIALGTQTKASVLTKVLSRARRLSGGSAAVRLPHIKSAALALSGDFSLTKLLTPVEPQD
ncbi:MAG: AAA family ATPase [Allorhizobium sp.]